jgi:hypothetical protein
MGLFARSISLDDGISSAAIVSESSDVRRIAKFQPALLQAITPREHLIFVSADVELSHVMALTSERIIYGSGSRIEYILEGSRVAWTTFMQDQMTGGQHHKYRAQVAWTGGHLKHQSIENFWPQNDVLNIMRRDYGEAKRICTLIDQAFGLR